MRETNKSEQQQQLYFCWLAWAWAWASHCDDMRCDPCYVHTIYLSSFRIKCVHNCVKIHTFHTFNRGLKWVLILDVWREKHDVTRCEPIVWPKIVNECANLMASALNLRQKPSPDLCCTSSVVYAYLTDCSRNQLLWLCSLFTYCYCLVLFWLVSGATYANTQSTQTKKPKNNDGSNCQYVQWHLVVDCIDRSWEIINCCCDTTQNAIKPEMIAATMSLTKYGMCCVVMCVRVWILFLI